MMKDRFQGIAQNIGDACCFLVLTHPDDKTEPPAGFSSIGDRTTLSAWEGVGARLDATFGNHFVLLQG